MRTDRPRTAGQEKRNQGKRAARPLALLLAVLLFGTSFSFRALALEPWPEDCTVLSEGACLMDADSGVVLFTQNAEQAFYPASITKVLTALLVIENCSSLTEMVTFSYDAVHIEEQNSTIIGASEGDTLSVQDCLYCLLFQSANEVANALAEHVGAKHPELKEDGMDDRQVFVKMMNLKAAELGCRGSHFNNPSGLTDEEHYTTPYDMCLIMQAAIRNETFCDIESHTYWKHAPIRRYPDADDEWNTVYMKHLMLRRNSEHYYEGCFAGKTGYTVTAGNTLVTACRRNGLTLVCCVMNAHANHYSDTARLFDFGYAGFRSLLVTDYDDTDTAIQEDFRVNGLPVLDSVTLGIDEETRVTIPKTGEFSELTKEFVKTDPADGDALAEIRYYYGEHPAGTAQLVLQPLGGAAEAAEAVTDPMFYEIAGISSPAEETAAEQTEKAEGSPVTGAEQAEKAEGSSVTGAEQAEKAGTAAGVSGNGNEEEPDSTDSGPAAGAEAALSSGKAGEQSAGADSETASGKDETQNGTSGGIVRTAAFCILGVAFLLALLVLFRYSREMKEQKRRRARRLERMQKLSDLPGTRQIELDLEVQRKLKKTDKRKKHGS